MILGRSVDFTEFFECCTFFDIVSNAAKIYKSSAFFSLNFFVIKNFLSTYLSSKIECFPLKHFFNNFVTEKKNLRPAHLKKKFFLSRFSLYITFSSKSKVFNRNFFPITFLRKKIFANEIVFTQIILTQPGPRLRPRRVSVKVFCRLPNQIDYIKFCFYRNS